MIRVKVIGAGGYGGLGIIELLLGHPRVKLECLVAATEVGMPISRLYPHLTGFCDLPILAADDTAAHQPADVVFMATPDRVGMQLAPAELASGAKVIDYSGDFRFNNIKDFAAYSTRIGKSAEHAAPQLLPESVYGLPELHHDRLNAKTRLVGNPGCFAVSCILGLAPAVKAQLVETKGLICDCKTGVSGAGKKPNAGFHYPARYDHMNAYKLAGHQHVCEVERELGALAGKELRITFTAQVVPVCRGIMSTLYGDLKDGVNLNDVFDIYRAFYPPDGFVRLFGRDDAIGTAHVRGSNYCNLILDVDERTRKLRVVAHIDNLMKGQAGSALQNMNLIFELPEKTGLDQPGRYP